MITDYNHMLNFVKETLYNSGNNKSKIKYQSFHSRFSHTKRVLNWCKKSSQAYSSSINEYVLFVSAIFHDVGYAISNDDNNPPHAEASVKILFPQLNLELSSGIRSEIRTEKGRNFGRIQLHLF